MSKRILSLIALVTLSACGGADPEVIKETVTAYQNVSEADTSGLTIVSNQRINRVGPDVYTGVGSNLCAAYLTTDRCSFEGGQLVKYSDGSTYVSGTFRTYHDDTANTDSYYADNFSAFLFKPSDASGTIILSARYYVAVGNPRILFLHWDRTTDVIRLVIDSNQNQQVDATDTVLRTLSLN